MFIKEIMVPFVEKVFMSNTETSSMMFEVNPYREVNYLSDTINRASKSGKKRFGDK